ncbi:MAG: hypothetical protein LBV67_05460 [Streptococcaceae bacterium]|nr:hypothetical protein [Streptococcaceae bacterium]
MPEVIVFNCYGNPTFLVENRRISFMESSAVWEFLGKFSQLSPKLAVVGVVVVVVCKSLTKILTAPKDSAISLLITKHYAWKSKKLDAQKKKSNP